MSVFAPLLGHMWRTLESLGVDPGDVIEERLYRPGDASAAARRISFADYDEVMARAAAVVDDPTLGLRTARYLHPSHLGALGHAWLVSPNLRSAMRSLARLARMYNEQVRFSLEESHAEVRLKSMSLSSVSQPDMIGDGQMANALQLCRMNFGSSLQPVDVGLVRVEPADPTPWLHFFGPVVRFGQAVNSLAFSVEDADAPLTGSNPELLAIHEEIIQRYLLKLDRENIVNRLRLALIEDLPAGRVSEDAMARRLHLSKRTLYRRLRDNGETFRSVLERVRRDLARHYVQERDFSLTEIAFLLGYNNTSAFSRAFKRWFGRSPSAARERSRRD